MVEQDRTADSTDLVQAKRIIAGLQATVAQLEAAAEPGDGEFTIFLDDIHTTMLVVLFQERHLIDNQNDAWGIETLLAAILSSYLEEQYTQTHPGADKRQPPLAPSA